MYSLLKKEELIKEFTAGADANLELVGMYGNLRDAMKIDDAEMVKYLVNEAAKNIAKSVPDGIEIPATTVYVSMSGTDNMINVIDLIVRSKYSSDYEFKFKIRIVYSEDVFEVVGDFLKCTYTELLVDALVNANLSVVNAKLGEIGVAAGNDFTVTLVSQLVGEGKKVVSIMDKEIKLAVDEEMALSLEDILLFCEPSEFITKDMITKSFEDEVAIFAQAQTTAQFLGVRDPLVGHLCGISRLIKPFTLIKKVYSKNISKIRGSKDTLAYFNEDGIYSVIAVTKDGKEVVLQPFNTDTLEVVDVDVLAKI